MPSRAADTKEHSSHFPHYPGLSSPHLHTLIPWRPHQNLALHEFLLKNSITPNTFKHLKNHPEPSCEPQGQCRPLFHPRNPRPTLWPGPAAAKTHLSASSAERAASGSSPWFTRAEGFVVIFYNFSVGEDAVCVTPRLSHKLYETLLIHGRPRRHSREDPACHSITKQTIFQHIQSLGDSTTAPGLWGGAPRTRRFVLSGDSERLPRLTTLSNCTALISQVFYHSEWQRRRLDFAKGIGKPTKSQY